MFKSVLLVCVALSSGQCEALHLRFGGFESVENMSANIMRDVTDMIGQIQGDVMNQFRSVNERNRRLQESIQARVAQINANAANGASGFDAGFDGPQTTGEFYSFNSNTGSSRSTRTGISKNGQAYRQETEEAIVGNNLYRVEIFYNLKTGERTTIKTTIDLSNPNAEPIVEKSVTSPNSTN